MVCKTTDLWNVKQKSALIGLAFLLLIPGCSTVVREMQRNESQQATPTVEIDDQTFSVSGEIWLENAKAQEEGPVRGRFMINAQPGPMPREIDLYHFQIMSKDWKRGLANYRRGDDGLWRKIGRGGGAPLNVIVTQQKNSLILEFAFSWKSKPQPYDVAISLSDSQSRKHILLASHIFAEPK